MEGLRSGHAPDSALSAVAEQWLLDAGRVDEAYARYAIQSTSANTNIATHRAIAKRYPGIEPSRILSDSIASTPREEGKWVIQLNHGETSGLGHLVMALVGGPSAESRQEPA